MTKSVLSRADISMLINSEEAKKNDLYGNLYYVLLQIKDLKAITIEELKDYELNRKGMAALTYNKHTLINNATKEWRATTDIIDNPNRTAICQLCNAPKLRYECHIRNIKNNTELLVGSECVNHFKIDGYINQKKQLAQIHKGHKLVKRKNQFYNHFPDYESFISNAEEYFSTLPILLPYDLYINLENAIKRMRLIATKYVNEGKSPYESQLDSFTLFQLEMDNYNELKANAEAHINKNINKTLICKRPEIDWLIFEGKMDLLQQISKNDGIYTIYTLREMYSTNFIQKYQKMILDKNTSDLVKFEKLSDNNIVFSFNKFGYQTPVLFNIYLKDFMRYIGADCIINADFKYGNKEILSISTIINSKRNLFSILEYIDNMMYLLNCAFLIDEASDSLYLCRKGDRAIRKFSNYSFVQNYSKYILLSDKEIKNYLISIVKGTNNAKWITTEVQSKQGVDDKIAILYKAYKESHDHNTHSFGKIFELMTYNVYKDSTTNIAKINFNSLEYITLQRNKLKIGDSQLRYIEYGIHINDESLEPLYHKDDILFIQPIQQFKNRAIIFFATDNEISIKNCYSESEEPKSIFNFTNIPKKKLIAYGKIMYCYRT